MKVNSLTCLEAPKSFSESVFTLNAEKMKDVCDPLGRDLLMYFSCYGFTKKAMELLGVLNTMFVISRMRS